MVEGRPVASEGLAVRQCWELLRSCEVGRLAVVVDGVPDIFPINHVVDHGSIVFRTAPGTKLSAIAEGMVAFEVDGGDADEVWSVVVKGRARRVEEPYEIIDATELPLYPWQQGPKPIFVRVEATEVTGRRFRPTRHGQGAHPAGD
jgi:nitroimidazol reductase NimA-like FMN-containing flavoprotein (pyridoxamine 5'-phosphate oxidase superfamily)